MNKQEASPTPVGVLAWETLALSLSPGETHLAGGVRLWRSASGDWWVQSDPPGGVQFSRTARRAAEKANRLARLHRLFQPTNAR